MMAEASEGECVKDLREAFAASRVTSRDDDIFVDADAASESDWRSARLSSGNSDTFSINDAVRIQELEEEQERLNNSLFSLSSHFAQIQFRLKQVSEAEGPEKDKLLKELQEFAFKGCADVNELKRLRSESVDSSGTSAVFERQKERQNELIKQLRQQLEDYEKLAYENGEGDMPSTLILQKQKAILDQLQEKTSINVELEKMSPADLQKQVDEALKQLVNPFKEKEQLVEQLQTQIIDLERFVNFLQKENESVNDINQVKSLCSNDLHSSKARSRSFFGLISCSPNKFQKNQLKQTPKGNHYGDERARLQLAVDATQQILQKYTLLSLDDSKIDEEKAVEIENDEVFERSEEAIVAVVRKQLCPALKALLEHGMLTETAVSRVIPGLGCFVGKGKTNEISNNKPRPLGHIWDVVLYYYDLKNGKELGEAPVRKLSQSFRLDSISGRSITSKQILLTTIENIISSHARLRRSKDSQWKAFVSAAMNEKKLPAWLRIIFRTREIVETCYHSWSYVARTGCEELYTLLEGLHTYKINLPVDLALRPFQQMKDAF
ncbi:hypothetical protein WR25_19393 [Diploscapter pachys]|uniref:RUN domain-containing protein n=1 Tax=Diploscapter pachys TaxID=2018661 RepID=A0A2A2K9B0_9BILA|nr:hypothetical protein WR25_19393 [Diploscapter pachys]